MGHVTAAAEALRPRLVDYLEILAAASGTRYDLGRLPADPTALAHMAAYLLQAPPEQKQRLLASRPVEDLLRRLDALYREELPLLKSMLAGDGPPHFGPFSLS